MTTWYDRDKDQTVYQLGLTPSELYNLEVMTRSAVDRDDSYVGCATDGPAKDRCRKAAVDLHERVKRLMQAAESSGQARIVIETEASGNKTEPRWI
jgi:hypothetical protein